MAKISGWRLSNRFAFKKCVSTIYLGPVLAKSHKNKSICYKIKNLILKYIADMNSSMNLKKARKMMIIIIKYYNDLIYVQLWCTCWSRFVACLILPSFSRFFPLVKIKTIQNSLFEILLYVASYKKRVMLSSYTENKR